MAFLKGHSKHGGRQKGTQNKRTVALLSIRDSLAAKSFDLGAQVMKLIAETADDSVRLKALELLAKYTQLVPTSEPKDDDETDDNDPTAGMSTEELLAAVTSQ